MRTIRFAVFSILLVMVFVTVAFLPDTTALAQDARGVAVPTTLSPHGTILDTTPTYMWSKVTGATIYRYQVYNGATLVLDKSPDSGICGLTTCEKSPAFTLGYNAYKWRVKAFKDGAWSSWSPYMNFIVSAPSFNSQFNGSAANWSRKAGGSWDIWVGKYFWTNGVPEEFTSAYYNVGQYTDFDYSARFYRDGSDVTYLMARMGTAVTVNGRRWQPGYAFGYDNEGHYAVLYFKPDGLTTIIQNWTLTPTIVKNGWNTLRVVAKGTSFWCYINGTLVKSFTSSARSRGYVGVMMWRNELVTDYLLFVDWAKLTVVTTTQ
jgi:hypothetical protein